MQNVKVRRSGISPEQAAAAIESGLGGGYRVRPDGSGLDPIAAVT